MKTTLLLCFIHGFKGGDDTFVGFPEYLRALVSHALLDVEVVTITYPKFDTRGDLMQCVGRFREWLQNKVIDLEVEAGTPSPTVEPSVRTILVGHSMGGIVAAETVLAITSEQPLTSSADPEMQSFMFPYIQGILAFDTPYLGIAPGVVAHGAEGHLNTASAAITQLSGLAGGMWGGSAAAAADSQTRAQKEKSHAEPKLVEPPPTTAAVGANDDAAATPTWQRWGKIAMFAGAAGAVAAGGAAAYLKRDQITEGWSWVGSHLEFVGCLVKGEEMQQRLQQVVALQTTQDMGFADLYTVLGAGASSRGVVGNSGLLEKDRTFCNLPKSALKSAFIPLINDAAKDEAGAHMYMFSPKHNPGYYHMSEQAKALIVQWAEKIIPRESPVRDAGAPLLYDNNAEDPEEKPPGVARSGNISRDGQDGLTSPVVAAGVVDEAAIWSS